MLRWLALEYISEERVHTNYDALAQHEDLIAQGLLERVRRLSLGHCLSFYRIDSHLVRLFLFRTLDSQQYTSYRISTLGWFRPGSLTASAIVLKPSSTYAYVPV
jgi:hypothetical protein